MNRYHLDCAIVYPSLCGLFGIFVAVLEKIFGISPIVTPIIAGAVSWWPTDPMLSGGAIGAMVGLGFSAVAVIADFNRKAMIRPAR